MYDGKLPGYPFNMHLILVQDVANRLKQDVGPCQQFDFCLSVYQVENYVAHIRGLLEERECRTSDYERDNEHLRQQLHQIGQHQGECNVNIVQCWHAFLLSRCLSRAPEQDGSNTPPFTISKTVPVNILNLLSWKELDLSLVFMLNLLPDSNLLHYFLVILSCHQCYFTVRLDEPLTGEKSLSSRESEQGAGGDVGSGGPRGDGLEQPE